MAPAQGQQDAGGSRAHPQEEQQQSGYLMRLQQLSREHDAAAARAAAHDSSGQHSQQLQQQQQQAAMQQTARRAHTAPGGHAPPSATRLATASLPGGQLDQPQRLQRVQEIVRQLEAKRQLQQQQEQQALQQPQPPPPPQQQPQPPPQRQHRRVVHVASNGTAIVTAAAAAEAAAPVALAAASHLLDVGRGWSDDSWEGVFKAAAPAHAPSEAAAQQHGAGVGQPQEHDTRAEGHAPLRSRFARTALPDEGSPLEQQLQQQGGVDIGHERHSERGFLQHRHSLPLQASYWQQTQLPRPTPARPAQGAARQLFPSQHGGAAASPPRPGVGVSFAPLRRSSGVDAAGGPVDGGGADGPSPGVCNPWHVQLQHLHHKLEARQQRQQPAMKQTLGELQQLVEELWGALTEQEEQHREAIQQQLAQHQQRCAELQQQHQAALEERQAVHQAGVQQQRAALQQLRASLTGQAAELVELRQQKQAVQQELDCVADRAHHLTERLAQALAEKSELQLHHLEMKQRHRRLQEDQERLISAQIDLTEQQQQRRVDQLRSDEQQRAHAREQQEQQQRRQQALLQREAQLLACEQQLQDAKAALQAEVAEQHAQIRAMLQKLQKQEQLMVADVRAAKASFAKDFKDEAQRHKELCQQHGELQAKHRELATKLRRLQRDHARLLDRKLECDRRMTSLQQQLQRQRKQEAPGSQAGGGGAKSSAAAPVARRPGPQQQIQLRGTAALGGSRQAALLEAEQRARAAAESKAAELELENQVLAEVLDAWQQSDSEGLLHSLSGQQQHQQQLLDATLSPIKGVVQATDAAAQAAAGAAARTAAAATILMDQQQQQSWRSGVQHALQPPASGATPPGPPAAGASKGPIFKAGRPAGTRQRVAGSLSSRVANMAAAAAMAELSVAQEQLAACKAADARQTQAASAASTAGLAPCGTQFGHGSSILQQPPTAGRQRQQEVVPVAGWDERTALFGLASPKVLQPECSSQTLVGFSASSRSITQQATQWQARRRQGPLLASCDAQPGGLSAAASRSFVSPPPSDAGADPHELPGQLLGGLPQLAAAVRGGSSAAGLPARLSLQEAHRLGSDNGIEQCWADCVHSASMTSSFVSAVGAESSSDTLPAAAASPTQQRRRQHRQQAVGAGAAAVGGPSGGTAAAAAPTAEQQAAAPYAPATGDWLDSLQQQMRDVEAMFGELRSGQTSEAGCSPAASLPEQGSGGGGCRACSLLSM